MATKKKASKASLKYKRTISEELFEQWKKMRRYGDPEAIAALLKVSKPTVDNALIYGCVHKESLRDGITKFFEDRVNKEKEDAQRLGAMSESQTQAV